MDDLPVPRGVCRWCGKAIEYVHWIWWQQGTAEMDCRASSTLDKDGWAIHEPVWTKSDALPDFKNIDEVDEWLRS